MKKIFAMVICVCLFFSFSFAEERDKDLEMTLSEAIQFAKDHNSNLVDISRTEKDQKELYDDAKEEYRKWKNKIRRGGYSFESVQEYLDCYGYGLETATLSYNSFLATKGSTEKGLIYSIKNMAYKINLLEKNIELLEKTIIKQENDTEIGKVKLALDMITESDYNKIAATLDTSRLELVNLKSTLENLKISLKKAMGYDVLKELKIILPEYEVNILEVEDLADTVEQSLLTNKDAIAAQIQYKEKEINNMLATQTSWFYKDEKKDAKEAFKDAKSRLDNEINSIKENLMILHQSVKTNEEKTLLAKDEFNRAKEQFDQAKMMYDLGMISKNSLLGSEIALLNAENTYNTAVSDNILLNERWEIAITVGDVVGSMK